MFVVPGQVPETARQALGSTNLRLVYEALAVPPGLQTWPERTVDTVPAVVGVTAAGSVMDSLNTGVAAHTVTPWAPYRHVFRVVGTAAFMAYGVGTLANGIWKGQPWSVVGKEAFDGLIYALLTAGTFGWLWPH